MTADPASTLILTLADELGTEALGRAFAAILGPGDVVGLVGTLGAGKTRLSRAIAEGLGVDPGSIASPTFVLIHEYEGLAIAVYHFDTYRLDGPEAFDALGAADYWSEGSGVCLIEWADLVADRLPESTWWVRIDPAGSSTGRSVTITHPDPARVEELASVLKPR